VYLDSTYIAKFYVNEPDSAAVRTVIRRGRSLVSSAWALGEVTCVFHRHFREGSLDARQLSKLYDTFLEHVDAGVWTLFPVTEALLRRMIFRVSSLPSSVFLRAGDAVHLVTAWDAGEREIWTNDRRLLEAAAHFGLVGRQA